MGWGESHLDPPICMGGIDTKQTEEPSSGIEAQIKVMFETAKRVSAQRYFPGGNPAALGTQNQLLPNTRQHALDSSALLAGAVG